MMAEHQLTHRLRRGWRAILIGALLGALLFAAYAVLSRWSGDYSKTLTFQLSDPKATMAELNLSPDLGVEDTAVGVADLLQSTAIDSFDLKHVRVVARGVDGSRMVAVTVTGSPDAVKTASSILTDAFPKDRAQQFTETADRAIASMEAKRDQLQDEVAKLDDEVAVLDPQRDDVFRERLLLDRLETTRQLSDTERQLGDLQRLRDQDPLASTVLVASSEKSVGTSVLKAALLGLIFGALVAMVVVLTRPAPQVEAAPA